MVRDEGEAEILKSPVPVPLTLKVKEVVCVIPPPVPVTVIGYEPVGVDDEVEMVKVEEKVGLPDCGLKEAEAPEGRPEAERLTVCVEPLSKVAVIVVEPEEPADTLIPPLLVNEKSNGFV